MAQKMEKFDIPPAPELRRDDRGLGRRHLRLPSDGRHELAAGGELVFT
jgi:hypothetical protein